MLDPSDIGHDGRPFPARKMLHSDFEVLPLDPEIDPSELRTEFTIEPQLGISFQ